LAFASFTWSGYDTQYGAGIRTSSPSSYSDIATLNSEFFAPTETITSSGE